MASFVRIFVKSAVALCVLFAVAFAQPKPKAAVYIMGNPEGRNVLRAAVNTFLVKSGKYQMIAVDAIDVVAQEQKRQMSGAVSDRDIAALGRDAGAEYVCVVERSELDGFSYVTTRMVNVQSKVAELADMVELPIGGKIIDLIQWQIGSMLGMQVGPRPTGTQRSREEVLADIQRLEQQKRDGTNMSSNIASGGGLRFTDARDGKVYRTVTIGGKTWMAENLNYPTSNGSWCWGDRPDSCTKYGRLYDWNVAQTVCPSGWHLPSRDEWGILTKTVGGTGDYGDGGTAGKKLKSKNGWYENHNGTDDFGFAGLSGGVRRPWGSLNTSGDSGNWWTATESGSNTAYHRYMNESHDRVGEYGGDVKGNGFSVRCVKN